MHTSRIVSGATAQFTWVPEQFLKDAGVSPWMELPLWVGDMEGENAGFAAVDCRKAIAAGLMFRPLAVAARDTRGTLQHTRPLGPGHREREADLLERWHARETGAKPPTDNRRPPPGPLHRATGKGVTPLFAAGRHLWDTAFSAGVTGHADRTPTSRVVGSHTYTRWWWQSGGGF
jgi:hypothetical protein